MTDRSSLTTEDAAHLIELIRDINHRTRQAARAGLRLEKAKRRLDTFLEQLASNVFLEQNTDEPDEPDEPLAPPGENSAWRHYKGTVYTVRCVAPFRANTHRPPVDGTVHGSVTHTETQQVLTLASVPSGPYLFIHEMDSTKPIPVPPQDGQMFVVYHTWARPLSMWHERVGPQRRFEEVE